MDQREKRRRPAFLEDLERRLPIFEARAVYLAALRSFFRRRRFLEVDAPLLVPAAGLETHLDPLEAKGWATGRRFFLPTSPEFYLKKLLASGARRCFSLGPAFRDEPPSGRHSTEFLMLEWYRPNEGLASLLRDCSLLLGDLGRRLLPGGILERGKRRCDLSAGIRAISLSEAFRRWVGRDWQDLASEDEWRDLAREHGASAGLAWTANDAFCYLLLTRIEPELAAVEVPVALLGYPPFQGALAREDPSQRGVMDRFELYVAGEELANAYAELTDAVELERRSESYGRERESLGKEPHPPDPEFLEAVGHLPPCAGIALGADRLLSLLLGKPMAEIRHGTAPL